MKLEVAFDMGNLESVSLALCIHMYTYMLHMNIVYVCVYIHLVCKVERFPEDWI